MFNIQLTINMHKRLDYFLYLIFIAACSRNATLDNFFTNATPYEKYKHSLEKTQLDQTALGADWVKAGEISLHDSLLVALPYSEAGYFSPEKPTALCLQYQVREGQKILITLEALSQPDAIFFMDVFEVINDTSFQRIQAADTIPRLAYEVEKSGWHAIRIQPELLRGGAFLLNMRFEPSLSFPVQGKASSAVGSFFGDPRDGGKRAHRGIDIFAPKGTPVLAASDGVVGRVTQNRLGGKVVWLHSLKKRFTQYYAHLDSQAVRPGQRVVIGDTIGFVGNTGNASTTPPHLHFSIYKLGSGAVDPYPFVHALLEEAPAVQFDSSQIGIPARTKAIWSNVRHSPTTQSPIQGSYPKHTLVNIEGKSDRWYRITLPNAQRGYMHDSLIESIDQPTDAIELTDNDRFYFDFTDKAIHGNLIAGTSKVVAAFDTLLYIQTSQGYYGWISER